MYYTVSQFKDGVAGMLSGIDLQTATNPNESIQRAARIVSQKVSVPDASLRIPYLIYDGVTDYVCPQGIFGGSFTDFRIQGASRNYTDEVYRQQIEDFDRTKSFSSNGVKLTIEWANGLPILRVVSSRSSPRQTISTMTALGNWTAGGNASGLYVDSTVYWSQPASLGFTLAANGTQGYLQETLTSPINLSSYASSGVVFVAVYLPSAAAAASVSSLAIQIGSDSSDYYTITSSAPTIGSIQGQYWMLFPFSISSGIATGTPNLSAMKFVQIAINYVSVPAIPNVRLGTLFAALPGVYEFLYQSASFFTPQGGVPQQTITTDNDTISLSDDIYNIFQHEAALAIATDNGATLSEPTVANITTVLNGTRTRTGLVVTYGLYDLYRARHPSEEIPTVGSYYL